MKKPMSNLQETIRQITNLKGKEIKMQVNRGRKKIEKYIGVVQSIYPSVFVVDIKENSKTSTISCSYSDVLCGDVKIVKS